MTLRPLHRCQCPHCQVADGHPDQLRHHQMNLFLSWLNEQQRRWYVALEAKRIGHGGDRQLSVITGMGVRAIRRGRRELDTDLVDRPVDRIRLPGGGRHFLEDTDPAVETTLVQLVAPETAGDPMGPAKWVRSAIRRLSGQLAEVGHPASRETGFFALDFKYRSRLVRHAGETIRIGANPAIFG